MKIQFKTPKYIIPLIILPFIFIFNYLILDFFPEDKTVSNLEDKNEMNTSLPNPNLEKIKIDDKMDNLKNTFAKEADFSAISDVIKEGEINDNVEESLYTSEEAAELARLQDSLKVARSTKKGFGTATASVQNTRNESKRFQEQKRNLQETQKPLSDDEQFLKEMAVLDSILNPEKFVEKPVVKIEPVRDTRETHIVDNAENITNPYFNQGSTSVESKNIEGLLDESIKVYQGSRVRIKLSSDIIINEVKVKKHSYVYGVVSGFKAERIEISISSIIVNNNIYEVDLEVYDLDGLKGLYVPSSKFREFSKELGSQSSQNAGSSIEIEEGNQRSIAGELIDQALKTGTQTLSKMIRKNKANLKYNTRIILINNKSK